MLLEFCDKCLNTNKSKVNFSSLLFQANMNVSKPGECKQNQNLEKNF